MNIVLIGMMGSGKSAVGREIARKLGWSFIDMDEEIEREQGTSVAEIFARRGEADFRVMEKELIKKMAGSGRCVIATGGGTPCSEENWKTLAREGWIVWLKALPITLFERIQKERATRPLLQDPDPLGTLRTLLAKREPFYEKADYIVETEGLKAEDVAEKIVSEIKSRFS